MQPYKYLTNFIEMPVVLDFIPDFGVVLVHFRYRKDIALKRLFDKGIWFAGIGTVLTGFIFATGSRVQQYCLLSVIYRPAKLIDISQ